MSSEERLKDYVERDTIYQSYINDEFDKITDFEAYCINHCKDILDVIARSEELTKKNTELQQKVHILNEMNERNYNLLTKKLKKKNKNETIWKILWIALIFGIYFVVMWG